MRLKKHVSQEIACEADEHDNCRKMNPHPPVDLDRIWVTENAFEQFNDLHGRYASGYPCDPYSLLSHTKEELSRGSPWLGERTRHHPGTPARYFLIGDWRFVVVERGDVLSVVTFEIPHHPLGNRGEFSDRQRMSRAQRVRYR